LVELLDVTIPLKSRLLKLAASSSEFAFLVTNISTLPTEME